MLLLISDSNNPYFNLATEEYLLKNTTENLVFLYQNLPCIVVGKHQNAMAEINYRFVHENKIPVIRRISGGGTVYHDMGNVNFTFIKNGEEGNLVNFKSFIAPVAEFLRESGIPAEIGVRNDILVNGLKVSGNAEHIYRKRTLHHGTLLFSSTLTDLRNALKVSPGKYTDKAVKSVRSSVTNINEYSGDLFTTPQFFASLGQYLSRHLETSPYKLASEAISQIQENAETKYKDWQWNFGYSPNYVFRNSVNIDTLKLSIEFQVEKGIIRTANIEGNLDGAILRNLTNSLTDQPHSFEHLSANEWIANLESTFLTGSSEILWSFF